MINTIAVLAKSRARDCNPVYQRRLSALRRFFCAYSIMPKVYGRLVGLLREAVSSDTVVATRPSGHLSFATDTKPQLFKAPLRAVAVLNLCAPLSEENNHVQ